MLGILGWRQMLLAAALALFMSGCYTVVSRSTPPERVASGTEAVDEPAPAEDENASEDQDEQASDDQYADDSEAAEEDSGDSGNFGIRAGKYTQRNGDSSVEYDDGTGKTIINNYYDYPLNGYRYSRFGYDPYEWCATPYYWPYFRVGIVYDPWDPFYWHDPWAWGFGFGWYGSYRYDPWYWGGGYAWDPWYRYSWHNHYYDPWYYGGGGSGGGDDNGYDGPRRQRADRLAGFGTSRGGVVNAGETVEKTTPGNDTGVSSARRSRDGAGSTVSRRRTSTEVSGVVTEKPSDTSTDVNSGTSGRRGSSSGDNSGRQKVRSGENGRRYQVMDDPDNLVDSISRPVRKDGDSRYRWKSSDETSVQREVSSENGESSVQQDNRSRYTRQRTQTYNRSRSTTSRARESSDSESGSSTRTRDTSVGSSQSERSGSSQSTQSGSTERSRPTYSAPERSSGSSRPSYSSPGNGGSRSGGGSSRSSGGSSSGSSQSGSRRR